MNEFLKATKGCVTVPLRESENTFLQEFKPMIDKTFAKVTEHDTIEAIDNAMDNFEKVDEHNKPILALLKLEFSSFVKGYMKTTGASENSLEDPPSVNNWSSKKVTAKVMLKAAKTIVDSLMEVLGDILPKWVKGLLNTLKEVFDFVIG